MGCNTQVLVSLCGLEADQRAVLDCMREGGKERDVSQHSMSIQYRRRARKNGRALSTRSLGRASTGSTCRREEVQGWGGVGWGGVGEGRDIE